jgi:hypothetical protein
MSYERSNADFTLFKVWNKAGRLLVFAVWVDDIITFGARADLDTLEADIILLHSRPKLSPYSMSMWATKLTSTVAMMALLPSNSHNRF